MSCVNSSSCVLIDNLVLNYKFSRDVNAGLSLYYANRYIDGAKQFRDDVAVNPNDTEEAIWAYLCEVRNAHVFGNLFVNNLTGMLCQLSRNLTQH